MTVSLPAVRYVAGDSVPLEIAVKDGSGVAVDITGASIEWSLYKNRGDAPVLTKSTSQPGEITIEPPSSAGVFSVELESDDTSSLSTGVYYHRATVTTESGIKTTVGYSAAGDEFKLRILASQEAS